MQKNEKCAHFVLKKLYLKKRKLSHTFMNMYLLSKKTFLVGGIEGEKDG